MGELRNLLFLGGHKGLVGAIETLHAQRLLLRLQFVLVCLLL